VLKGSGGFLREKAIEHPRIRERQRPKLEVEGHVAKPALPEGIVGGRPQPQSTGIGRLDFLVGATESEVIERQRHGARRIVRAPGNVDPQIHRTTGDHLHQAHGKRR
jgi:hypothetical protein